MAHWSPVSYVVLWQVDDNWTSLISIIYIASWILIFLQSSIMDAWELLGIKQVLPSLFLFTLRFGTLFKIKAILSTTKPLKLKHFTLI